jgi:hypothetical protein
MTPRIRPLPVETFTPDNTTRPVLEVLDMQRNRVDAGASCGGHRARKIVAARDAVRRRGARARVVGHPPARRPQATSQRPQESDHRHASIRTLPEHRSRRALPAQAHAQPRQLRRPHEPLRPRQLGRRHELGGRALLPTAAVAGSPSAHHDAAPLCTGEVSRVPHRLCPWEEATAPTGVSFVVRRAVPGGRGAAPTRAFSPTKRRP